MCDEQVAHLAARAVNVGPIPGDLAARETQYESTIQLQEAKAHISITCLAARAVDVSLIRETLPRGKPQALLNSLLSREQSPSRVTAHLAPRAVDVGSVPIDLAAREASGTTNV